VGLSSGLSSSVSIPPRARCTNGTTTHRLTSSSSTRPAVHHARVRPNSTSTTSSTADAIEIDAQSLLVGVPADKTLDAVETALAARGFTLGVALDAAGPRHVVTGAAGSITVGDWLAQGAPGAASVFADPADHVVAGLEATLPDGKRLEIRPGPRRAVGPDLTALVFGTHRRLASVEHAWLRIHRRDARRPAMPLPAGVDLDPPVSAEEARLLDAIVKELGGG
jgi:alkyldihydroxyacetonephosphate synthase